YTVHKSLVTRHGPLAHGAPHHDDVSKFHGLGCVVHWKSVVFGDFTALAPGIETNDNFAAAVLQIEGMGMPLRAEAENGEGLALENCQISVFVGVNFRGHK